MVKVMKKESSVPFPINFQLFSKRVTEIAWKASGFLSADYDGVL